MCPIFPPCFRSSYRVNKSSGVQVSIEIFARHTMKFYNPFYAALHHDAKSTYSYDQMKRDGYNINEVTLSRDNRP